MRIKRLIAIYIDYMLECMVVGPIIWIIEILIGHNINYFVVSAILMIFLSFKDILFKNKSLGKKMLNLEIISMNGKELSKSILIFRNLLTGFLFPIEVLMILLFNRRIGDYIFNTSVQKTKE